MQMQSNIEQLAKEKGFINVQQFSQAAGMSRTQAQLIWNSDISNRSLKVMQRAALTLGCQIEDLFTTTQPIQIARYR